MDGQSRSSEPSAQSRDPSHLHLFGRHRFSFSQRNSSSLHRVQLNSSSPKLQSCRPSQTHRSGMQVLSLLQRYSFGRHSPSGAALIHIVRIISAFFFFIFGFVGKKKGKKKIELHHGELPEDPVQETHQRKMTNKQKSIRNPV